MSDILDEIKEDLSREKYAAIWKKNSKYIIALAVIAVATTAGVVIRNNHMIDMYQSYSNMLYLADNSESDSIEVYSDLINNSNATYKSIAMLRQADILLEQDKADQALTIYQNIISDASAPQEYVDIATLLSYAINMNTETKTSEIRSTSISSNNENIFRFTLQEFKAFKALGNKDYTTAYKIFSDIVGDKASPISISNRAKEMLKVIESKEIQANG